MGKGLTQERLKELILYNPDTGKFTWRVNTGSVVTGGNAGCKRPDGYIMIRVDGELYYAHRLANLYIEGSFPDNMIGHLRGDRSDNRWDSLSNVTNQENCKDQKLKTTNKSGICGVYLGKPYRDGSEKWQAQIKVDGKSTHLYKGPSFDEACRLRKEAEIKYKFHEDHGKR